MCRWAEVSESGFYAWRRRYVSGLTSTQLNRIEIASAARKVFADSGGTYGHRRIEAALKQQGVYCSRRTVSRVMAENRLVSKHVKKRRGLTKSDPRAQKFVDQIRRDFTATEPGVKLVGDVTQIRHQKGWTYLATVIDLFNREIIGHAIGEANNTDLIKEALIAAAPQSKPAAIFHSDHGSNYTSHNFQQTCLTNNIVQSMGRTGSCFDNAAAESFFATIKKELTHKNSWQNHEQTKQAINHWITSWYNTKRLHSKNGYKTPQQHREKT